jgi:ABC-2 type transport system permease protein
MVKKMKRPVIISEFLTETKRIYDTRSLFVITIVMPPVLFFFFAFLYQNALVKNIPIAIIDNDNSVISRTAVSYFGASSSFSINNYYTSLPEAREAMIVGEIDGIVFLPKDFEKDLKKGEQVHPIVFANGLNVIKSNYILSDATKIFKTISGGVLLKKFRSGGMSEEQAIDVINPIRYNIQTLYNSNYSYVDFLVPALCVFTIFMSFALAGVTVFNYERFVGEKLTKQLENPINSFVGRTFPYLFICAANVMVLVGIVFPIFGITMRGSVGGLFLFTFLFGVSSLFLGMFVSTIVKNIMLATQIILFFTTPAFVFSGLTYPIWAMPETHQIFAQILPYTHFLDGFIRIYLMGEPMSELGKSLNLMVAGVLIPAGVIILILKVQGLYLSRKLRSVA